jgi:hypothetical protein
MKIIISVIAIAVLVAAIGAPNAFAISVYESGFQHGVSDGRLTGTDWYILQPGKGFQFHTWEFVQGYVNGFCSVSPHTSSDAESATWDCAVGPTSASWMTSK